MKGQPGNHTVLVGSNLTLPCELILRMVVSMMIIMVRGMKELAMII